MRAAWKHGVLAILLSGHQDHWRSWTDEQGLHNHRPIGCHSRNLENPTLTIRAADADYDYGYDGEVGYSLTQAAIQISATCRDCGNPVYESFDLDDDVELDLHAFMELMGELTGMDDVRALWKYRDHRG